MQSGKCVFIPQWKCILTYISGNSRLYRLGLLGRIKCSIYFDSVATKIPSMEIFQMTSILNLRGKCFHLCDVPLSAACFSHKWVGQRALRGNNWNSPFIYFCQLRKFWSLFTKLERGCHAWRIPVTERTPCEIFHTGDTKHVFWGVKA